MHAGNTDPSAPPWEADPPIDATVPSPHPHWHRPVASVEAQSTVFIWRLTNNRRSCYFEFSPGRVAGANLKYTSDVRTVEPLHIICTAHPIPRICRCDTAPTYSCISVLPPNCAPLRGPPGVRHRPPPSTSGRPVRLPPRPRRAPAPPSPSSPPAMVGVVPLAVGRGARRRPSAPGAPFSLAALHLFSRTQTLVTIYRRMQYLVVRKTNIALQVRTILQYIL